MFYYLQVQTHHTLYIDFLMTTKIWTSPNITKGYHEAIWKNKFRKGTDAFIFNSRKFCYGLQLAL